MKLKHKIKNIFMMMITGIIGLYSKVFAYNDDFVSKANSWKTRTAATLYGVETPEVVGHDFIKIFVIPIALLVGIFVYLIKSKSSKKRKIITVSIILLLVIVIYIIFRILYNR